MKKIGGQWIFGGTSDFSNLLGQWLQELNVEGGEGGREAGREGGREGE